MEFAEDIGWRSRRVEVRLWSHLRFTDETEPSSNEQIYLLASDFAEPFGDFLRSRTGATTGQFQTITATRSASGIVEIAFFLTYFSLQAALAAPQLFQMIAPTIDEMAGFHWRQSGRRVGHEIRELENRFWIAESVATPTPKHPQASLAPATYAPTQAQIVSFFIVGIFVLILVAGGYWLAFKDNDPFESRLEAIDERIRRLEEASTPSPAPITQTVTVVPASPQPIVIHPSLERDSRTRRYCVGSAC